VVLRAKVILAGKKFICKVLRYLLKSFFSKMKIELLNYYC